MENPNFLILSQSRHLNRVWKEVECIRYLIHDFITTNSRNQYSLIYISTNSKGNSTTSYSEKEINAMAKMRKGNPSLGLTQVIILCDNLNYQLTEEDKMYTLWALDPGKSHWINTPGNFKKYISDQMKSEGAISANTSI